MNPTEQIKDLLATYEKHGWQLRRVLLSSDTRAQITDESWAGNASIEAHEFDGLWFSRKSQGEREAWHVNSLEKKRGSACNHVCVGRRVGVLRAQR